MDSPFPRERNYASGPHAAHLKALEKNIKRSNGDAVAYFMFELLEVHKVEPYRICEVFYNVYIYLAEDKFWPLIFGTKVEIRMASKPLDTTMKGSLCRLAAQLTHAEKVDWTEVESVDGTRVPIDATFNRPEGRLDLCSRYPKEMDADTYPFIMNLIRREKLRYLPGAID